MFIYNKIIVTLKALNRVRVGDEEEINHLMEYLNSATTRE